jgi:hypothetical protein
VSREDGQLQEPRSERVADDGHIDFALQLVGQMPLRNVGTYDDHEIGLDGSAARPVQGLDMHLVQSDLHDPGVADEIESFVVEPLLTVVSIRACSRRGTSRLSLLTNVTSQPRDVSASATDTPS